MRKWTFKIAFFRPSFTAKSVTPHAAIHHGFFPAILGFIKSVALAWLTAAIRALPTSNFLLSSGFHRLAIPETRFTFSATRR
jgi:hypothetical protein